MMPIVAFDEAGNTGGNLLDAEQPVFVLASVCLSDEHLAQFAQNRDGEYKFSALKRSSRGRQAILELLDSPILTEDSYLVSGFHKEFMIVTKMVDLLIEPLAYRDGIDLYERGANIAVSNMLYYCLPAFLDRNVFNKIIRLFLDMVRTPDLFTVQQFYSHVQLIYRRCQHRDLAAHLSMLLATKSIAEEYLEEWDGSDLDPAIPAFVEHASVWTSRLKSVFQIVHDQSKPIVNEQLVLEAMMSETEPKVCIGYDRRKMTFPIGACGIDFRDSRSCLAVQIADIIASAVAYCLKASVRQTSDEFVKAMFKTRVLTGNFRSVWPELKVTPQELKTTEVGGVDSIGRIGQYVAKRLGGIPPKGARRK